MPMIDRPDAPLIPATADLLWDWCGPVVDMDDGDHFGWRHDPALGAEFADVAHEAAGVWLDLRRPEVQDRVARVWWGASGAVVVSNRDGACALGCGGAGRACAAFVPGMLYIPALASLPDTDTLAWALWECWRAMEVDRG